MAKKEKAPASVITVNTALLAAIGAASAAAPGYMNVPQTDAASLGNLVEVNPDPQFANAEGHPAVRISALGTSYLAQNAAPVAKATAAPVAAQTFKVLQFALPEAKRVGGSGGARPEVYPFSKLEVGDSFFVPATAEKPNPAKSFGSTVASATNRYAEDDTSQPKRANRKGRMVYPQKFNRKFAIRPLTAEQAVAAGFIEAPGVAGAVVGRIA